MVSLVWKRQALLLPSSLTHLLPQPEAKGKLVKEGLEFPRVSWKTNSHGHPVFHPLLSNLTQPHQLWVWLPLGAHILNSPKYPPSCPKDTEMFPTS